ncbi:integrin alpha [Streptomyces sp. A5-4]|uniref:integrin alpha n=1 Tax=Streptomyces sp. A5-4 TaxID=3384771 RepID=UPI003DA8204A
MTSRRILTTLAVAAAVGVAFTTPAAQAAPAAPWAQQNQPDLNGDGYDDLAVGVPLEDHHGLVNAGAFVTLNGSADGLRGAGAKAFSQDTPGVRGRRSGATASARRSRSSTARAPARASRRSSPSAPRTRTPRPGWSEPSAPTPPV